MHIAVAIFDAHFFAFAGVAALLVLSPGATMVVVADAAIEEGRRAALWTVAGIGTANGTMALSAAFGLAAVIQRVPAVLRALSIFGAVYLGWLGIRALWRALPRHTGLKPSDTGETDATTDTAATHEEAVRRDRVITGNGGVARDFSPGKQDARHSPSIARFGRGLLTNYANPSVVIFYAVVVSQFITPQQAFLPRYLLLGGTHVAMSVVWQGMVGISVGVFAERMARPGVRRGMDLAMGVALLAFAVKIAIT